MKVDLFEVKMQVAIDPITDRAHYTGQIMDRYWPARSAEPKRPRVYAKSPDFRTLDALWEWVNDEVVKYLEPIEPLLPDSVHTGRIGLE
ncbi:hypothetical protein [Mycolicibacterium phlei]|uniref:hypothetical protein n=1 Tax=Mycolicibacterium phlei TaxID=1771 RepID=UPI0002EC013B|nr:hypothetical protein [Mycolicibacterium phlei]MBF4194632.1 hypothetical protein [Mycolicibacterium phlei]